MSDDAGDPPDEHLLDQKFTLDTLAMLRQGADEVAAGCGLPEMRRADFVLAVNEVASNAVLHGGGEGHAQIFRRGDALRCQISDSGPGFDVEDLLVSEVPTPAFAGGRGLWLCRQIVDQLRICTSTTGTTVTLALSVYPDS